jgi:hypothetical protein
MFPVEILDRDLKETKEKEIGEKEREREREREGRLQAASPKTVTLKVNRISIPLRRYIFTPRGTGKKEDTPMEVWDHWDSSPTIVTTRHSI